MHGKCTLTCDKVVRLNYRVLSFVVKSSTVTLEHPVGLQTSRLEVKPVADPGIEFWRGHGESITGSWGAEP